MSDTNGKPKPPLEVLYEIERQNREINEKLDAMRQKEMKLLACLPLLCLLVVCLCIVTLALKLFWGT